jgi:hypothetical protein
MHRFYSFNNSTTFVKSLTISRLDISNLLSTKKKPWCAAPGLSRFHNEPSLLVRVMEMRKPVAPAKGGSKAFSLLSNPLRITERSEVILQAAQRGLFVLPIILYFVSLSHGYRN